MDKVLELAKTIQALLDGQLALSPRHLLLTIAEAAEELRISEGFVEGEIRAKRLAIRKLGRLTRIERTELQRWISEQPVENVGTIPGQYGSASRRDSAQVPESTGSRGRNGGAGHD